MAARAYAGGNWKDAQRQAEQYWRDTKGGLLGEGVRLENRQEMEEGWQALQWQADAPAPTSLPPFLCQLPQVS